MAIPAPATNALIDRINALVAEANPSELAIARIKAEAKALLKVNAAGANAALGMIAGVEGDREGVVSYFDKAFRLEPGNIIALKNYVIALTKVGLISDVAVRAVELARRSSDDIDALQTAYEALMYALRLSDAKTVWGRLESMNAEIAKEREAGFAIEPTLQLLESRGSRDEDLASLAQVAANAIHDKGFAISGHELQTDASGALRFVFQVQCSDDAIPDLNWAIAEAVVSKFDDTLDDIVTFSANSSVEYDARPA